MKKFLAGCALMLIAYIPVSVTAEPSAEETTAETASPYAKGTKEFEDVVGTFFYFQTILKAGPAIDFAVDSIRLGLMLNNPHGSNLLAGNFEALGEVFGAGVFDGLSGVLAGSTLIFRYNFIQPRTRFVPYLQGGGGFVYTSFSGHESRDLVSLPVEFNLQAGGGVRYRLDRHWSLLLEAGYRHISNAGLKNPNFGINSVGGDVGLGYLF